MNSNVNAPERSVGPPLHINDLKNYLKREHRFYGLSEEKKPDITITAADVLNGMTWDHVDFTGRNKNQEGNAKVQETTLYMVIAGDNQSPCRWNGQQLAVQWIEEDGVPLFTKEEATYVINCTYKFFESVGRTAHPILRAVPVFQIPTI